MAKQAVTEGWAYCSQRGLGEYEGLRVDGYVGGWVCGWMGRGEASR
jgi:hypothetical protein